MTSSKLVKEGFMNVQTATQTLEALRQEQAAIPDAIKQAVQRTQRAEVRRLQARESELVDLIADAEISALNAQIAALPNQAALDLALRQAEAAMSEAEREHVASVTRLVAAQETWRAAYARSLANDMERANLTLACDEAALRAMPETGEVLYSITGHRM